MNETKHTDKSIKVCFLALGAYSLLSGKHSTYVVGPDVLQVLLAKELIKHNFEVTLIASADGRTRVEYLHGIEVITTMLQNHHKSFAGKVFNHILLAFSIWKALRKAKADVYFQQGGVLGIVELFCRLRKKQLVVSVGSDAWVSSWSDWFKGKFKGFGFGLLMRFIYGLDIRLANTVIVMNEFQKTLLKKNFSKDGLLIKHHLPLTNRGTPIKAKPPVVLWVGTITEVKQPGLFLKLAEAVLEARFQIIGGFFPSERELYDRIKESAQRIPNLDFLGFIPFTEVNEYFEHAAILVNTSRVEAYPPFGFIQAWMNYAPVVSLNNNSDDILFRYRLGFHSRTFNQLVEDIRVLLGDEHLRQEMGENGRQYVEKEHNITNIVKQYTELFNRVGNP